MPWTLRYPCEGEAATHFHTDFLRFQSSRDVEEAVVTPGTPPEYREFVVHFVDEFAQTDDRELNRIHSDRRGPMPVPALAPLSIDQLQAITQSMSLPLLRRLDYARLSRSMMPVEQLPPGGLTYVPPEPMDQHDTGSATAQTLGMYSSITGYTPTPSDVLETIPPGFARAGNGVMYGPMDAPSGRSGTNAEIRMVVGGRALVSGLSGLDVSHIGHVLILSSGTHVHGPFTITSVVDSGTTVWIEHQTATVRVGVMSWSVHPPYPPSWTQATWAIDPTNQTGLDHSDPVMFEPGVSGGGMARLVPFGWDPANQRWVAEKPPEPEPPRPRPTGWERVIDESILPDD